MDMLWAILPFFNAGLVAAVFARFYRCQYEYVYAHDSVIYVQSL